MYIDKWCIIINTDGKIRYTSKKYIFIHEDIVYVRAIEKSRLGETICWYEGLNLKKIIFYKMPSFEWFDHIHSRVHDGEPNIEKEFLKQLPCD